MVSRRRFIALIGGGAVAAGGAIAGIAALPGEGPRNGPPTLRYGEERCAYCGMTIGDARFAAAWRDPAGAERHFDDIGCMVNAARREAPGDGAQFWVHDYGDQSWLDATSAAYLVAPSIKTPMAYGVAAFAHAEAAQAASRQHAGRDYAWTPLLQNLERKS